MTKLGRLVKAGKIKSMEEIYLHSLPIKEYQIVDWFLPKLKDEVMKVSHPSEGHHVLSSKGLEAGAYKYCENYRSNQYRSKLGLVNVLDSRQLL